MISKFVLDPNPRKETMHRRVNSNAVDLNSQEINFHRRTMSNSDIKFNTAAFNLSTSNSVKHKPHFVLPDSLNSSSIQPCLSDEKMNFIEIIDSSLKHFISPSAVPNPLRQISEIRSQIFATSKSIENLKENRSELNEQHSKLKTKSFEVEQENSKLEKNINQMQAHIERLKNTIVKTENELKMIKSKNEQKYPEKKIIRKEMRSNTFNKEDRYTSSSNDEFEVFNAEENTYVHLGDPFQFINPSPRVQEKNLYQRIFIKK